jgi:uncharacterized membrane protein
MNKRVLDRYFCKLRRKLPCSKIEKQRILSDLRINTENWMEAHPGADEAAFLEAFGTPDAVAKSYIEQMDPTEISKKLKTRKIILGIILVLAAAVLLIWLLAVILALVNHFTLTGGHLITHPVEIIE